MTSAIPANSTNAHQLSTNYQTNTSIKVQDPKPCVATNGSDNLTVSNTTENHCTTPIENRSISRVIIDKFKSGYEKVLNLFRSAFRALCGLFVRVFPCLRKKEDASLIEKNDTNSASSQNNNLSNTDISASNTSGDSENLLKGVDEDSSSSTENDIGNLPENSFVTSSSSTSPNNDLSNADISESDTPPDSEHILNSSSVASSSSTSPNNDLSNTSGDSENLSGNYSGIGFPSTEDDTLGGGNEIPTHQVSKNSATKGSSIEDSDGLKKPVKTQDSSFFKKAGDYGLANAALEAATGKTTKTINDRAITVVHEDDTPGNENDIPTDQVLKSSVTDDSSIEDSNELKKPVATQDSGFFNRAGNYGIANQAWEVTTGKFSECIEFVKSKSPRLPCSASECKEAIANRKNQICTGIKNRIPAFVTDNYIYKSLFIKTVINDRDIDADNASNPTASSANSAENQNGTLNKNEAPCESEATPENGYLSRMKTRIKNSSLCTGVSSLYKSLTDWTVTKVDTASSNNQNGNGVNGQGANPDSTVEPKSSRFTAMKNFVIYKATPCVIGVASIAAMTYIGYSMNANNSAYLGIE